MFTNRKMEKLFLFFLPEKFTINRLNRTLKETSLKFLSIYNAITQKTVFNINKS